jgi:zinc transport system permease protein
MALPFIQRALLAGVLVAACAAYYGVFIVQRRMSFLGHGLAHSAFGGVALGLLLGQEPLWIALPFTIAAALGIAWLSDRTRLASDTSVGILLSLSMALGVVFMTYAPNGSRDGFTYLFGSILAVSTTDLWAAVMLAVLALASLGLWGRWAYSTFDRESALADRLPVRRDDALLAVLIAVTVVVAVKIVGAVLVSAFLVIPAATMRLLSRRFGTLTLGAVICGALSSGAGLMLSCWLDLPSGAAIVLLQTAGFGLAWLLASIGGRGQS